ncbi:RepB family plasmid replication initiator protein [Vibrio agarivorans]|uniref:RepB family plasmid replication initiator protein n=1 Tax=Vibrio agarivorans TaxID=153622 RepID=A0ABT7Y758_9VIBR|nr:RepB family plasmid replication initiator protein [Vibrio agarivorans]MDN2483895.1 RepB family plasmid replication initiator protein [Vibrio agarivorans]
MTRSKKSKKSPVVRQANALTTAAYSLTRTEKRLVYLGLISIGKGNVALNEFGQYPVDINHSEYKALFDDAASNASRDIGKAAKDLNRREVIFFPEDDDGEDGEKAEIGMSWTTKRFHKPRRGQTTLFFNAELIDIIVPQGKDYTKFLIGEGGNLTNPHYMRLFESLSQWSYRKKVKFSIEWMIERYELPKSYTRMSDFRRRFLHPAMKEINDNTSLSVEFKEVPNPDNPKQVKHIEFTFRQTTKPLAVEPLAESSSVLDGWDKGIFEPEEFEESDAMRFYQVVDQGGELTLAELNHLAEQLPKLMSEVQPSQDFYTLFKSAKVMAKRKAESIK